MSETIIFLYLVIGGYNSYPTITRTPMASMAECSKSLSEIKIVVAPGAESENAVVAFCGGADFVQLRSDGRGGHFWAK